MDNDREELAYTVDYRDIKYPRLEFKTGNLMLVLPKNYRDEERILEKHEKWIAKKKQVIQDAIKTAQIKQLDCARTVSELKDLVSSILQRYQTQLETEVNKVIYKKMKTKWASHSQKRNLTINSLLKFLPENLIEYVLYHELIHSRYGRKHDREFWKRITQKFPDHETKENDLLVYWFLVQKEMRRTVSP